MQRVGELHIERGIILGQHELAVGFFAHLDVGNGIFSLLEIGDLGRRVFRDVEHHGDRDHRGQAARRATGVEQIESNLIAQVRVEVCWFVPGVD